MSNSMMLDHAQNPEHQWADRDLALTIHRGLRPAMFRAAREMAAQYVTEAATAIPKRHPSASLLELGPEDPVATKQHMDGLYARFAEAWHLSDVLIGQAPMPDLPSWWRECIQRRRSEISADDADNRQAALGRELIEGALDSVSLERVGPALFGARWQSELARALGINDRTIRRWIAEDSDVPTGVRRDLKNLLIARARELAEIIHQLNY